VLKTYPPFENQVNTKPKLTPAMLEHALGLPERLLSEYAERQTQSPAVNGGLTGLIQGILGKFSSTNVC
jgi:hypothetical protein